MHHHKEEVSELLEEWNRVKLQLEQIFRERDRKRAKEWMEKGIGLFIKFLFLTNEFPDPSQELISFKGLDYKPVNTEERIGFIQAKPDLFHSFRQLSELMVEQEKIFVRKNIIKKSSRQ